MRWVVVMDLLRVIRWTMIAQDCQSSELSNLQKEKKMLLPDLHIMCEKGAYYN